MTSHDKILKDMAEAAEMLWVVLANVSGGDWKLQSIEWQEAAERTRNQYFAAVKQYVDNKPTVV